MSNLSSIIQTVPIIILLEVKRHLRPSHEAAIAQMIHTPMSPSPKHQIILGASEKKKELCKFQKNNLVILICIQKCHQKGSIFNKSNKNLPLV